ncbi:hypothetical protein DPX16_21273 [Anabarilius grahami]|uniref:Uncharacterized protein n=1 Tax=Anabarilius grahami TaxID=495550 RepID=A0A3N0XU54_ANAGA|nr:hypothetical protein DPX16_21273 [Anabarilius grahami]
MDLQATQLLLQRTLAPDQHNSITSNLQKILQIDHRLTYGSLDYTKTPALSAALQLLESNPVSPTANGRIPVDVSLGWVISSAMGNVHCSCQSVQRKINDFSTLQHTFLLHKSVKTDGRIEFSRGGTIRTRPCSQEEHWGLNLGSVTS